MTPAEQLQQSLGNSTSADFSLPVPGTDWQARVRADATTPIAHRYQSLEWERPTSEGSRSVGDWATGLPGKVTGLLEPLKVIEVDDDRQHAILRSEAPTERGSKRGYYELELTSPDHAKLSRYEADSTTHTRQPVPFTLTHEVAGKLISDVAE
ncbi:MAG: hypothetical protein ACRC8S_14680 [Fimbriiglobus sp.]